MNLYHSLGNDPLNSLDPSGLDDDIPLPEAVAIPLPNPRLPVLSSPPPASASGLSGRGWWYPSKYLLWRYREWWREWELDAQLDEVQRRLHDPAAVVMSQSSGGTWSVRGTYTILDPAFERNWQQGISNAAVLARIGVEWSATGPLWVSSSSQFALQGAKVGSRTGRLFGHNEYIVSDSIKAEKVKQELLSFYINTMKAKNKTPRIVVVEGMKGAQINTVTGEIRISRKVVENYPHLKDGYLVEELHHFKVLCDMKLFGRELTQAEAAIVEKKVVEFMTSKESGFKIFDPRRR